MVCMREDKLFTLSGHFVTQVHLCNLFNLLQQLCHKFNSFHKFLLTLLEICELHHMYITEDTVKGGVVFDYIILS